MMEEPGNLASEGGSAIGDGGIVTNEGGSVTLEGGSVTVVILKGLFGVGQDGRRHAGMLLGPR